MLRTRCIYTTPSNEDGIRISIMSRHTLSDGVTRDAQITFDKYDLWLPSLGPPSRLIGDYYKRGLPWDAFAEHYLKHIATKGDEISDLIERCAKEAVTLLCCEEKPDQCHRRLLAEYCKRVAPELSIHIE